MTLQQRRLRANLLLLMCAIIWGFAFVAQSAGAHIGAFTFSATRFAMGAVSLLPLIVWLDRVRGVTDGGRRWRDSLLPGLACGLFLFAGNALQQIGIESTTAGHSAFVTGLYVVMVPVVGYFLGHRATGATWAGVALAVIGLYLITVTADFSVNPADLITLGGTAFWTAHILTVAHFSPKVDPLRLSVWQFAWTAVISAPFALLVEPRPFLGVVDALGPLLYAGVVSAGVGFTLQVVAQADAIPSHASMIMSLEAMFGALGGFLLLGEIMTGRSIMGAALMMAGILLAQVPSRAERAGVPAPVPEPASTAFVDD